MTIKKNSLKQKLKTELIELTLAALYFATWISVLMILKRLILAQYMVEFNGLSLVFISTLILAKVVIILEHVPLGIFIRTQPAWVTVIVRSALYGLGVLVVLIIEKSFEGRYLHGGFGASLRAVFHNAEIHHVWANTICISCALLGYNALSLIRRHLGKGGLLRLFTSPINEIE